jgi:hypothetical protein
MKILLLIIAALPGLGTLFCGYPAGSSATTNMSAPSPVLQQEMRTKTGMVQGQVLTSAGMPSIRLKFDKAFKYVGTQSFILYNVAHAEQHFFVDADNAGRVKRMYWIQFEGYLSSNTNTYKYASTKTVNLAGLDFIADAYARNIKANPGRSDSDGSRARAYLASKQLRLASDEVISQRLVHLVDESKRDEVMIIYLEDLSAMGLTAADVAEGGKAFGQWNQISKELLERALKNMEVSRP